MVARPVQTCVNNATVVGRDTYRHTYLDSHLDGSCTWYIRSDSQVTHISFIICDKSICHGY